MEYNVNKLQREQNRIKGEAMENIVEFWLRTLNLRHHFPAFVDNGYDDLETCKKVRETRWDFLIIS